MLGFDSNRVVFAHLPLAMRYRRVLWHMNIQPRLSIRARDDGEVIFEAVGTLVRSP